MTRICVLVALALGAAALLLSPVDLLAQQAKTPATVKAGKGEKVCRYKFPSGERRAWVCKKEEPCCAWDAFNYVKCGSTITGCL